MLYSMTGYGKSTFTLGGRNYVVEIKTLNSKSCDLNLKAAADLRGKEIEIRKQIASQLIRGKIDVFFQEDKNTASNTNLNLSLLEQYYVQLKQFSDDKKIPLGDIVPAILRFQDIAKAEFSELSDADFLALQDAITIATLKVIQFRKDEGTQLENDILSRIVLIQQLKNALIPLEQLRIERIREKINQDIASIIDKSSLDKNRFEEELIYYLEKIDINEEKVRLESHCSYFLEIVKENGIEKGKKLGFVAQEIGREINTIGSKANDADIQKLVVQMKDELEKIKEQLMNIL